VEEKYDKNEYKDEVHRSHTMITWTVSHEKSSCLGLLDDMELDCADFYLN
jgi:hypothetical protein